MVNAGYLACARCSNTGSLVLIEPVSTVNGGDRPLSAPKTERCSNCSGSGKVYHQKICSFNGLLWTCPYQPGNLNERKNILLMQMLNSPLTVFIIYLYLPDVKFVDIIICSVLIFGFLCFGRSCAPHAFALEWQWQANMTQELTHLIRGSFSPSISCINIWSSCNLSVTNNQSCVYIHLKHTIISAFEMKNFDTPLAI